MLYSSLKISYLLIFFLNFLTGVEYGVVIPTALEYLTKYNGNQVDLGLCVSAYSLANLFSSPIMGKISDITQNTKVIILVANIFQIGGSFMYFMGIDRNFIIAGRFVSGLGMGCLGCVFSDIVKTTDLENRSSRLSRVMVGRQIGLIMGPAFNLLVLNIKYQIGPFLLDNSSAPGLLMTCAWFILQILILFFYKNLTEFENNIETQDNPMPPSSISAINSNEKTRILTNSNQDLDSSIEQSYNSLDNENNQSDNSYQNTVRIVDNSETIPWFMRFYNEYIRDEVIAVYFTSFTVIFMQTSLETFLTPFTRDYFGWTDAGNSTLYAIAGVEIMLVFLMLSFISKKINDRNMLITGLFGNLSTLIILIVYLPHAVPLNKAIKDYLLFGVPVFFNVFSLPLIVLPSISLLSKVTDKRSQGLTQGMRQMFTGLGCIIGPNWAGSFYRKWSIFLGVLIGFLSLSLCMALLSFKKLKGTNQIKVKDENKNEDDELLNNS